MKHIKSDSQIKPAHGSMAIMLPQRPWFYPLASKGVSECVRLEAWDWFSWWHRLVLDSSLAECCKLDLTIRERGRWELFLVWLLLQTHFNSRHHTFNIYSHSIVLLSIIMCTTCRAHQYCNWKNSFHSSLSQELMKIWHTQNGFLCIWDTREIQQSPYQGVEGRSGKYLEVLHRWNPCLSQTMDTSPSSVQFHLQHHHQKVLVLHQPHLESASLSEKHRQGKQY